METLFDVDPLPEADGEPRVARLTSKGIAPGDVVEVDKKGRRFHALVLELHQRDSGRFDLVLRPFERGITWRQATVREVVAVWRRVPAS